MFTMCLVPGLRTHLGTAAAAAPAGFLSSGSKERANVAGRVEAAQQRRARLRVHAGRPRQHHPSARMEHAQLRSV